MNDRPSLNRRRFVAAAGAGTAVLSWPARGAAPAGALTAVTLIHGIPGQADSLREHLLSLAAPTRAEPGCITYDLYESPAQPHEFMRLEVWQSAADLERHKATPHLRASFAKRQREGWTTQILTWHRVPE